MVKTQEPGPVHDEDQDEALPSRTVLDELIDTWWSQTQRESDHGEDDADPE